MLAPVILILIIDHVLCELVQSNNIDSFNTIEPYAPTYVLPSRTYLVKREKHRLTSYRMDHRWGPIRQVTEIEAQSFSEIEYAAMLEMDQATEDSSSPRTLRKYLVRRNVMENFLECFTKYKLPNYQDWFSTDQIDYACIDADVIRVEGWKSPSETVTGVTGDVIEIILNNL
ncbi:hypothetical protein Ddc_10225 [Ditylenchus destructor]|nr:hypothetical protein Ddc_10225 [Ditylenchus destructor]